MFLISLCALPPAFAGQAPAITLQAGVAQVEITPSMPLPMAGYAARKCSVAAGVADPLFAKALVLSTGEARMAIVTLDLISFMSEKLRKDVAAKLGIPILLLAAAHDHSGPSFGRSGQGAAYVEELEGKVFEIIRQASSNLFPARLAYGRGSIQLGYNRLPERDGVRTRALFVNTDRLPYGPVDPEVRLLRVEDLQGNSRALLVHYACHAVALGHPNCKYSADYPGVMRARVESQLKGTQCMFVQGGAGDINPLLLARTGQEKEDFATMARTGELLGAEVLRVARDLKPAAPMRSPIQSTSEILKVSNRWDKEKTIEIGITTVLINREIAIAATPGETFHKLQQEWTRRAEVPFPLFFGYTYSAGGGWPGYIPDLRSAAHGGYGADNNTNVEIGTGEKIVERHLMNLYNLLGMWLDKQGES